MEVVDGSNRHHLDEGVVAASPGLLILSQVDWHSCASGVDQVAELYSNRHHGLVRVLVLLVLPLLRLPAVNVL